jgi:5'-nucleotidase
MGRPGAAAVQGTDVGVTLEGQLVVAISSRALFDFEAENELFEQGDDRAYMKLQLERLEQPASPGVAFSLVRKLLAFNDAGAQRVEVVILSRNDPVSGMRVFRSAQHYGLPIQRGSFTRGAPPWRYLKPLNANLFLSAHLSDVRAALDAGVPGGAGLPAVRARQRGPPERGAHRLRRRRRAVQRRGRAVFQAEGLSAFQQHEKEKAALPLSAGPFKPLLAALQRCSATARPPCAAHGAGHGPQRAGP